MRLSAVLTVRDEERMLVPCLELLGFADEIVVVVDSRSADATEALARRFTDRVLVREFDTFAGQKNHAIRSARGEWVLIVDADERVTPALAREIAQVLDGGPTELAFDVGTRNFFLGQAMDHGGWRETHVRLVRREHARYTGAIHETFPIPRQRIGALREPMWHFSHRSVEEMLRKTVNFGHVQSLEMAGPGRRPVRPLTFARTIALEFAYRMVWRRGYRDGMPGIIEAIYQPFSLFCVQVMVWQRQQRPTLDERYAELERAAVEHR